MRKSYAQGMKVPIVNPDSIRLALHGQRFVGEAEPMVWTIARYMVIALFGAGHDDVIIDATNTTVKRREEWVDPRWIRVFCPMAADKNECLARAARLNDMEIVPIVEKMAAQFEPVTDAEIREWEKLSSRKPVERLEGEKENDGT
jgi:hypothetical protein